MHREIVVEPEQIDPERPLLLAIEADADPRIAQMVIDANVDEGDGSQGHLDGRSNWKWIRFANGDLMLACWPHGETYEATEEDPNRP